MGRLLLLTTLLLSAGCEDFNNALQSERKPVTPAGIASPSDVSDVQQAASGGYVPAAESNDPAPAAQPETRPATQSKQSIVGKTTAKIVDAKQALKNSTIVVVENKLSGQDPLTIAATAYISITSRASALNFKRQLDILKATNGRYPTFEEYEQLATQLRITFARLPPFQMYGYDSETGGVVILEDKAEKIRRYKEAGIEIDTQDKKYE